MSPKVLDRDVVVTGASSGIGRATALALAERKASVALAARSGDSLRTVVAECERAGGRALAVPTDVTDQGAMESLAERAFAAFGRIDAWVNCAAVISFGGFEDTPAEVYRRVIDTNLFGQIHGARAVLPYFRDTTSSIATAQRLDLVKWVKSKIQILFGTQATHCGQGRRDVGSGAGGLGSRIPASASTRSTVDSDTYTRPRREPRWASLRWLRSTSPHSSASLQIASRSHGRRPWAASSGPGRASSRQPAARRTCQRPPAHAPGRTAPQRPGSTSHPPRHGRPAPTARP